MLNPEPPRRVLIYSRGEAVKIVVGDQASASLVGRYMSAVGKFLSERDYNLIKPFIGQSVVDTSGKRHPFETDPNRLHQLDSAGGENFHDVYRIVL